MKEKFVARDIVLAIALAVLLHRLMWMIVDLVNLSQMYGLLLCGLFGGATLVAGLFYTQRSLSYGLTMGGIWLVGYSFFYYQWQLDNGVKFALSLIMLAVICLALYKHVMKKGK